MLLRLAYAGLFVVVVEVGRELESVIGVIYEGESFLMYYSYLLILLWLIEKIHSSYNILTRVLLLSFEIKPYPPYDDKVVKVVH